MPKTRSAKNALRQSRRRDTRNVSRKNELKTAVKQFARLLAQGKQQEAATQLSAVYKKFDKMAKVGLIKKGKAQRVKSRLSKKLGKK